MSVLSTIVRWSFAFSPIVSFYPQLAKQQRTGVDDGYSRGTAFLLISSHSLRLFWWLAQPFDPSLLVQSLCTIVMQLLLLNSGLGLLRAVENKKSPRGGAAEDSRSMEACLHDHHLPSASVGGLRVATAASDVWEDAEPYMILFGGASLFLGCMLLHFTSTEVLVRSLATISAGLEGVLAWPQIYSNYRRKDTSSLSLVMVASWFVGDALKVVAFMCNSQAPRVLVTSAVGQCVADAVVLMQQLCIYPSPDVARLVRRAAVTKLSPRFVLNGRSLGKPKLSSNALPLVAGRTVDAF